MTAAKGLPAVPDPLSKLSYHYYFRLQGGWITAPQAYLSEWLIDSLFQDLSI